MCNFICVMSVVSITVDAFHFQVKAKSLVQYYHTLIPADKQVFLKSLATDYNVDQAIILQLAHNLSNIQVLR